MKEKIAVRVEEVKAWSELAECLDSMTDYVEGSLANAQETFKECYPDGGEDAQSSQAYKNIQKYKAMLAAYDCVRTVILKAIG